ncbi:MAG: MFS transporter [Sedimentibacter saalensis]|jgi:MFS family permease|uniref:MFS transporter n=1 Tax=Sedimentibacter saalensis TaxID=130788 RepID=A0A562J3N8_9FIRM|nr:MFS transporter [Sedimentibacter saalensis]MEA5095127.1 MFS transporter [Sedimentibacter saalensis]TWH77703.1 MFS transporter [Sedimentibacter saalensis]
MNHNNETQIIGITEKNKSMKKFTILVAGQFISSIGSGLTDFGLAIYVLRLTGSVTATSILSICAFLPSIVLAPIGGVLADHYDRRLMMILGELFSGLGLVICLISVMSANPSIFVICSGVAISSLFSALMEPAFKATITDLLCEEDYARAGGMVQIAFNSKLLISPAVAGLLLRVTPVSTLIIIDIFTFFTTVFVIAFVRKGMAVQQKSTKSLNFAIEMKEGVKAIRGKRGVVAMIVIMSIAVFCLGFVQILSKPLILAFAGETELGLLATVSAFGMMAGSIAISMMKNIKSHVRLLSSGLFGCGIFFALMGVRENLILIAAFGFMMFVFLPFVQIGAEVLIRKNLANEVQGRAFGLISFITQMGYIFAYILSGLLADYVFEPFMKGTSPLVVNIGNVIGTGNGRGIALLILIAGLLLAVVGIVVSRLKSVKTLEEI